MLSACTFLPRILFRMYYYVSRAGDCSTVSYVWLAGWLIARTPVHAGLAFFSDSRMYVCTMRPPVLSSESQSLVGGFFPCGGLGAAWRSCGC